MALSSIHSSRRHAESGDSLDRPHQFGKGVSVSSFCGTSSPPSERSSLERMSHLLDDPLPPGTTASQASETPQQRKLTSSIRSSLEKQSSCSSSILRERTVRYPSPAVVDRRSSTSSSVWPASPPMNLVHATPPRLSPLHSAPFKESPNVYRQATFSHSPPRVQYTQFHHSQYRARPSTTANDTMHQPSPPRPVRKVSTGSDISPSLVEALVGAACASPLTQERPSTYCIATPRQPLGSSMKISSSDYLAPPTVQYDSLQESSEELEKDDSSVASTAAVATPAVFTRGDSDAETKMRPVYSELSKVISRSFSKFTSYTGEKASSRPLLIHTLIFLFSLIALYKLFQVQSELSSVNLVLNRMEQHMATMYSVGGGPQPSMILEGFSMPQVFTDTDSPQPQVALKSPDLSPPVEGVPMKTVLVRKQKPFWLVRVFKWLWHVPLRIKPRKRSLYMSTPDGTGLTKVITTVLAFLCKTVIRWIIAVVIKASIFLAAILGLTCAVLRISPVQLLRPWVRSGYFCYLALKSMPMGNDTSKLGK